jgi:peptidoglycan-associated lipoprotein
MIKKNSLIKNTLIAALVLSMAACSSTRHRGGSGSDLGADGSIGGAGGGAGAGAYAEGAGGGAGFQPSANCNVPQTGGKTHPVYFAYDKSEVHPDDMSRLQALAGSLGASHVKMNVVGNTDNRGSREYNIALGWRRANAVATVLEQAGVSKQQVNTNSNGAEKPIAFGTSEDDFQCNRRVDVTEK